MQKLCGVGRRIPKKFAVFMSTVAVLAVCGAARADEPVIGNVAVLVAPLHDAIGATVPTPLSDDDAALYRDIFDIQERGEWKKADALISRLSDPLLMGHVLAQRYLHPNKYRSKYKELKAWMDSYADHPDAPRLYKLALSRKPANWKRPKPPLRGYLGGSSHDVAGITPPRGKKLSRAGAREVRALKRKIRSLLRSGWTKAAKQVLVSKKLRELFSDFEMDQAKARLANGYFADGRDTWAVEWAAESAARSGPWLPEANWTAGLASWRLGKHIAAARFFEAASTVRGTSTWLTSAAAFWAARAHLISGNPQQVNALLARAAAYPRTFYGLLARRILGVPNNFDWQIPATQNATYDRLLASPAGRRVLGLTQIGEQPRAERDLRGLAARSGPDMARDILALAGTANMPALAVRLNGMLYPSGGGFDGAAYPLGIWQPAGGYHVDKALVFALIRQESGFNSKAKSWAGARGLMQLMPRTASFVARDRRFHRGGATRSTLFDPQVNLKLGQRYIEILLKDAKINGDLFLLAAAWNGGPGNLNKWRRNTDSMNDPLFFIESLPSRETRIFIERVLANLWIYRDRLGQPSPSLDAIAAGDWPVYVALDNEPIKVAKNVEDRWVAGLSTR